MQGQLHILISQFNLKLSNKNFHISSKTVARLLMNQAPRPQDIIINILNKWIWNLDFKSVYGLEAWYMFST